MVMEVRVLPEMLEAGVEALEECEARKFGKPDTAIAVYLAMQAIFALAQMREKKDKVH